MATTSTSTATRLPRVSVSGMLILATFLGMLHNLLRSSRYAALLMEGPGDTPDVATMRRWSSWTLCFLHASTCAASFLNVLSHAAVALGALNDTYVLSILVGVGFDVLTRILQLVWWISLTRSLPESTKPYTITTTMPTVSVWIPWSHVVVVEDEEENPLDSTPLLLLVLALVYVYHMMVHVRALLMNQSLARLQAVLTSALNNLRGIPGEGYLDHVFAYTDLGTHLVCCGGSAWVLRHHLGTLWMAVGLLVALGGISYGVLSRIPRSDTVDAGGGTRSTKQLASMIQVVNRDERSSSSSATITCWCKACTNRRQRLMRASSDHHPVSFTFHASDGICQLWLSSFEELSGILSLATKP